jgi:hypothetical protein
MFGQHVTVTVTERDKTPGDRIYGFLLYEVGYVSDCLTILACLIMLVVCATLPAEKREVLPKGMLNLCTADLLSAVALLTSTPLPGIDTPFSKTVVSRCRVTFLLFLGLSQCVWFFTFTVSLDAHKCLTLYLGRRGETRHQFILFRQLDWLGSKIVQYQALGWCIAW